MKSLIQQDLYRYGHKTYSFKTLLSGLRTQGFRYIYFLRKTATAKNRFSYLFYKFFLSRYSYKYGFQIHPSTEIGGGLYIGHFGTLIISMHAKLGQNCNLSPGVTIGRDHRGKRRGAPTIGNEVWIGTNAVLVGKINIGNNVLIAPGAFVNRDIPANSIVLGNPGKIIPREDATEGYINNKA